MATAKNPQTRRIIPFVLIIASFCSPARARIIYVDNDAAGANDGASWADAYLCLQDALTVARPGDEICVAQGIHRPDEQFVIVARTGPQVVDSGDRAATFQLRDGMAIRGGYAGFGEPDPDARDVRLYETILSGDLNSDDGPGFANNAENSYHVVTGSGTDATAVLDGFTVTGGNANYTPGGYGGGMYNSLCRATVTNCTFSENCATRGAGMANTGDVGILSGPTLTDCVFSGNRARWGGGMCIWQYCGGTLTNCAFSGNTAEDGGAVFVATSSEATLRNCTLAGNWASAGDAGAIFCGGDCSATLVNTILWDNSPNEIDLWESSITVTYSDVQGAGRPWPGEGNINADPLFANPRNGDYHLKSRAGRWIPGRQVWVQDDVTSPCIDAGDPNSPLAFEPFPNGGVINMGAYGGTAEASKSPSGLHAKYSGGTGEPNNPYRIATAEDLMLLGDSPEDYGKHFILTADIDLYPNLPGRKVFDKAVIAPDANDVDSGFQGTPFTGVFDGNGHTILNLTIIGKDYLGLFGQLGATVGEVRNLQVVGVNVVGSGECVGGLMGEDDNGTVANCFSHGKVMGNLYVGGLVGYNAGPVTCCYSTAEVSGSRWSIGGLVGYNCGRVKQCYSTGAVSGNTWVGGLVGENASTVAECYSAGAVSGRNGVGGLVGYAYAYSQASRSFWDIQTSGHATSAGGTGKTTAQMRTASTFLDAGWDLVDETANGTEDIWWIDQGRDYPHLSWELGGIAPTVGADITKPGDRIKGVPNDGDWPNNEAPPFTIDDNIATKYLHFKGDFYPDPGTGGAGFRVTPSTGQTTVLGLTFTTANDYPGRDPVAFELSGSNVSIDGPYSLIASGEIVDFNQRTEWPRFTKNRTPISFHNSVAYNHYQLIFTAIRGPAGGMVNSMQIAEVELSGLGPPARDPSPSDGMLYTGTWVRRR